MAAELRVVHRLLLCGGLPAGLPTAATHVPYSLALHRELFAQLVRVMRELAAFVGCHPQELALVPNSTTGKPARLRRSQAGRSSLHACSCAGLTLYLYAACHAPRLLNRRRSTGLNTVVQSWRGRLGPGDALFSLDIGYGSVKKMLAVLAEQTGAEHVEMAVQLPLR